MSRKHRSLASQLRRTVDAEGIRLVGFDVGCSLGAVEHEVSRHVHKGQSCFACCRRQPATRVLVDQIRALHIVLGSLDIRVRSGVDHRALGASLGGAGGELRHASRVAGRSVMSNSDSV